MASFFKNAALVLISIIGFLLLVEIFLRLGGYKLVTFYPHVGFHQYIGDLGWTQIPNQEAFFKHREFEVKVTSNSHGVRDDESPITKPPGRKRIVVLGDFHTWGWGVEHDEIFCEVAEKGMVNTEFINLGTTSYGTAQEYVLFKKLGIKFFPDYTVVAFYPNDLKDNSAEEGKRPKFVLQNGELVLKQRPHPFSFQRKVKWVLQKYFYLYFFIDYKIALLKQRILKGPGGDQHFRFEEYFRKDPSPQTQQNWEVTQALLIKLHQLANRHLLIMYIPHRLQVEVDTYRNALKLSKVNEEGIDIFLPNKLLKDFSETHGIPFLDVTPILRQGYAKGLPIYFDTDLHLTKEGHRIIGNELRKTMSGLLTPGLN